MWYPPRDRAATLAYENLQGYVTDLELEIDRLRKQSELIQHEALDTLKHIHNLHRDDSGTDRSAINQEAEGKIEDFAALLENLKELPGDTISDEVIEFELRSLIEKIFRWHQRFLAAKHMQLNLELDCEKIAWFPVRFRHILNNLISNSIKFRDSDKGETRLTISFSALADAYELRVVDNGVGIPTESGVETSRALLPDRPLGVGVGLSVVKTLVEQCGGTTTISSSEGRGTSIVVLLPRFDIEDSLS